MPPGGGLVGGGRSGRRGRGGRLGVAGDRRRGDRRPLRASGAPRSRARGGDAGRHRGASARSCRRARPTGAPRSLVVWCEDSDAERRASLDRRGFAAVRQYFEMEIDLDAGLPRADLARRVSSRAASGPASTTQAVCTRPTSEAFAEHHLFEAARLRRVAALPPGRAGRRPDAVVAGLGRRRAGRLRHPVDERPGRRDRRPRRAQAVARSRRRARPAAGGVRARSASAARRWRGSTSTRRT